MNEILGTDILSDIFCELKKPTPIKDFDLINTSLIFGLKAQTDQNFGLYATTQFEKQGTADINSKFAFGVNFKF